MIPMLTPQKNAYVLFIHTCCVLQNHHFKNVESWRQNHLHRKYGVVSKNNGMYSYRTCNFMVFKQIKQCSLRVLGDYNP